MSASGEWINYGTASGEIRAFTIKPNGVPPWPTLIVIHAVNGIVPDMEEKAAYFAAEGYFTVLPDIYSNDPGYRSFDAGDILTAGHMGPDRSGQERILASLPPSKHAEILRARDWISNRRGEAYIGIIRGCYDYLRTREDVGAIGCLGYCMGGRLTGELAATGAALAAGVIYYGAPPKLELVGQIRCPLQGHYAATDHGITGKVPAFADAMATAGKDFTYFIYDADHGFSNVPGIEGHSAEATRESLARIKPFLAKNLLMAAPFVMGKPITDR